MSVHKMYSSLDGGYNAENIGFANLCLYRFISFFLFPNKKISTEEPDSPLDRSITYMKENIGQRLTTEDIAKRFDYSPSATQRSLNAKQACRLLIILLN